MDVRAFYGSTKRKPARSKPAGRKLAKRKFRARVIARVPSFTETISAGTVAGNSGGVFTASIDLLPQLAQYSNLYRQYKLNWVKVMLIPNFSEADSSQFLSQSGLPRIAWAVNTTPGVAVPASEAQLLEDNGSKIRPITTQWSASFKPTPNIAVADIVGGGAIPTRMPRNTFLNFLPAGTPNPEHYGISYWLSNISAGGAPGLRFNVYYKVNFSLRDPQ